MSIAATAAIHTAQLAAQMIMLKPKRGIFPDNNVNSVYLPDIIAQATFEERHIDQLELTQHPIEQGAAVTDHAYVQPSIVILRLGWSNSSTANQIEETINIAASWASTLGGSVGGALATAVGLGQAANNLLSVSSIDAVTKAYNALLDLYIARGLFTLYTGKRTYYNMILRAISTETEADSANSLFVVLECQQLLLVDTQIVSRNLPNDTQAEPSETGECVDEGTQQPMPASLSSQVSSSAGF